MKILVVDDDPVMVSSFELSLEPLGHVLASAANQVEAESRLRDEAYDVVLLDQNLEGPGGGPVGLNLIESVRAWSPGATIFVISGNWNEPNAVQAALEKGADDYLVKGPHLNVLLAAKLRHVDASLTQRWVGGPSDALLEKRISDTWRQLQVESNPQRKGALLEDLMVGLLRAVGGFREVTARRSNDIEELDVVAFAADVCWHRQSPLWLLECKNWSGPVGRDELDVLVGKMARRHELCKIGIMVAWSGVSRPFARTAARQDWILCVVDREDLQALVGAPDRAAVLQKWVDRATLAEA